MEDSEVRVRCLELAEKLSQPNRRKSEGDQLSELLQTAEDLLSFALGNSNKLIKETPKKGRPKKSG